MVNPYTLKILNVTAIIILLFVLLVSCGGKFKKKSSNSIGIDMHDYYLIEPLQYKDAQSAEKKYPLFVYLHGSGAQGGPGVLPCLTSNKERTAYPAFIYIPHTTESSWDNNKLIQQIEHLLVSYPIDNNRIYLMGYSMGGSGTYTLANAYYESKGKLFAGIVRMAGQSQTTLIEAIPARTSIWYHVGLADTPLRIQVAKESYQFLKTFHGATATETRSATAPILKTPGTTLTLTKHASEVVKYTEYDCPVGHGINELPLKDPYVLQWLFSQSRNNL